MNNESELAFPASATITHRPSPLQRALAWLRTRDALIACGLLAVGIVTRALAVPASLWEWDDILFARALHRYNLVEHSPHPPGFPIFVLLARGAFWILRDEHRALTAVAFLFGALLLPALFYLFREILRDRTVAAAAALLTGFAPNVWVQTAMGRSDGPGLTVGVIALALILRGLQSRRALLLGCAVFGLGMGVRVTLLPVVAPALAVVWLVWLWRRAWKTAAAALVISVLAALCWYVPLVAHTSWTTYRAVMNRHAQFTFTTDSIFAATDNAVWAYRLQRFLVEIWGAPWVMWTIYTLAALGVLALLAHWRKRGLTVLGWMVVCFVPFIIFTLVLNTPLSAPLYSLPYVPFFSGLAACGLVLAPRWLGAWLRRPALGWVGLPLAIGLTIALMEWTYPVIWMMHHELSPSHRAMQRLQATLDPQRDLLLFAGDFSPHVSFYLPNQAKRLLQDELVPEANLIDLALDRPRIIGVTTEPVLGATDEEMRWMNGRGSRRLRVLSLGRYFDAYLADLTGIRNVAFLSGWYPEERDGARGWRWMGPMGRVALRNTAAQMMLRLRAESVVPPGSTRRATLTLKLDGVEVARFTPDTTSFEQTVTLTPDPARLWSVLEVATDQIVVPSRIANIPDDRELGLRCYGLTWEAAPGAPPAAYTSEQILSAGWQPIERSFAGYWRWAGPDARAHLPAIAGDARLDLRLLVPADHAGRRSDVTVSVAGQVVARFEAEADWFTKTIYVPASLHGGAPVELHLSAQQIDSGADPRALALQVSHIGWMPAVKP